jgi:hypothetical protein
VSSEVTELQNKFKNQSATYSECQTSGHQIRKPLKRKLTEEESHLQPSAPQPRDAPFRLPVGRQKGRTIQHVLNESPEYFVSLVLQTPRGMEPYHDKPALKTQLINLGLWDYIISKGQLAQQARLSKHLGRQQSKPSESDLGLESRSESESSSSSESD